MFYKQGEYAKATQAFERAAQMNTSAPEVNMNKALLALMENKPEMAQEIIGTCCGC